MKPRLFRSDETSFASLGYGVLNSTISCIVTEELGVAPTLEMSVINNDPLFQHVSIGNMIGVIPNKNTPIQAFVIEEITKPIDGIVTIYATHIAQHRGKLIPVAPFSASNLDEALSKMVSESMESNPFTLVRDSGKNNVVATMSQTVPHSFRELMGGVEGSVLDIYRGEWAYDNFVCTLYNKRGRDNGAKVMYGRNMSDFNLDEQFNWDNSVTGVIGYWINSEDNTTVIGDIQYSEYADLYPYNKTVCMDFSDKFETAPSKADLNTYALSWINGKGLVGASVDVAYEQVNVEGGADVGIGDIVHIFNGAYNFEMESRIVGLEFDVLSEEYTNVTIGDMKTTLNEAISEIGGGSTTVGGGGASVEPSTSTPLMDGTAQIGTEQKYARGDHVHPTDTSRVAKSGDTMTGNLGLRGGITLSQAAGSSTTYSTQTGYYDTANVLLGSSRMLRTSADLLGYRIGPQRSINGSWVYNFLTLHLADDGTRSVQVSASKPWREAIGPVVGDVICTSSGTNPSGNYGGTWELVDKEFTPTAETARTATPNSTNCDAIDVYTLHSGHTIHFWVRVKTKVAITDSTLTMATFTPADFGVADFGDNHRITAFSDAGNALISWYLTKAGTLQTLDGWAMQASPSQSVAARQLDYFEFIVTVPRLSMLNSWCNRFYWRRTA